MKRIINIIKKGINSLRQNGLKRTGKKVKTFLRRKFTMKAKAPTIRLSGAERKRQAQYRFPRKVVFSILVPLYNTPLPYLEQMIRSVQAQTYENWELCLADGSDGEHAEVGTFCRSVAQLDSRILYRKLEENRGISENTNACIDMSSGNYLALLDHDDLLHPAALFENMRAICEENADFIYSDELTFKKRTSAILLIHYKPDFSPDLLRSQNYICHFSVFSRQLLEQAGRFSDAYNGSQDYDMVLRLTEKAEHIVHIPEVLYFWRAHAASVAGGVEAKPYCITAAKRALTDHLKRVGLEGTVTDSLAPTTYKINYAIHGCPLVSIIIPNKDEAASLQKCLRSIAEKSTYENYEIIVVENNSTKPETFELYEKLKLEEKIRIVYWKKPFNYSAINNFGVGEARGEYLLLLNNDVEIITPGWIEEMLMFAQRPDVGAVGAKLYYPDDTVQHAGIIMGLGGVAGHSHKNAPRDDVGYFYRLTIAQNLSGVTGACLMTKRSVWEQVGGLNEAIAVAFNDVDFCLRIRAAGYLIVFTPYAELYHYESKSRGQEDTPEKIRRFNHEVETILAAWGPVIQKGDPYYNPHLTLDKEDFSLR